MGQIQKLTLKQVNNFPTLVPNQHQLKLFPVSVNHNHQKTEKPKPKLLSQPPTLTPIPHNYIYNTKTKKQQKNK